MGDEFYQIFFGYVLDENDVEIILEKYRNKMENDKTITDINLIKTEDYDPDDFYVFEYINGMLDDDIMIFSHCYCNDDGEFYFLKIGKSVGGETAGVEGNFGKCSNGIIASRYISVAMNHFDNLARIGKYAKNNVNRLEKSIEFLLGEERKNYYELKMISTDQYVV